MRPPRREMTGALRAAVPVAALAALLAWAMHFCESECEMASMPQTCRSLMIEGVCLLMIECRPVS